MFNNINENDFTNKDFRLAVAFESKHACVELLPCKIWNWEQVSEDVISPSVDLEPKSPHFMYVCVLQSK